MLIVLQDINKDHLHHHFHKILLKDLFLMSKIIILLQISLVNNSKIKDKNNKYKYKYKDKNKVDKYPQNQQTIQYIDIKQHKDLEKKTIINENIFKD